MKRFWSSIFFAVLTAGCPAQVDDAGIDGGVTDAGGIDAGHVDGGDGGGDAGIQDAGSTDAGSLDGGGDVDAGIPDAGPVFLTALLTEGDLQAMADEAGQVKYLAAVADAEDRTPPLLDDCYFQNTQLLPFHIEFLTTFEALANLSFSDYIAWVLRAETRVLWGGSVFRRQQPHPLNGGATLAFSVYDEDTPGNRLTVAQLQAAHLRLSGCIPFAATELAYIPQGTSQRNFAQSNLAEIEAAGIGVLQ